MSLAENTYQVVLRLDPDNISSRKGLKRIKLMNSSKNAGNEAFKAGKWREAEQHYTQALELDSHLKSSFVAQCACNRFAFPCTLIQPAFNMHARQYVKLVNSSKNAGNQIFKAGKWTEAEQHCKQALELDSHLMSSFVAQCACNRFPLP